MKNNTNYIVIGAQGFIGSNLSGYLTSRGKSVMKFDVESNGNIRSIKEFFHSPKEIFESKKNVIINCAGKSSVVDSFLHPQEDLELNTGLVEKLLEVVKQQAVEIRFLNLSSAAVYGNPKSLPISEEMECQPISPYGLHKSFSEQILNFYRVNFGIQTASLRIFSAYGPGLKRQLFWDLFRKATLSDELVLFGTGDESRDFIYIDDLVRAIEILSDLPVLDHCVYNVSSGKEVTIREAADIFIKAFAKGKKISFSGEVKAGDPVNWRADVSRLNSTGFQPGVNMESGIKNYIEWLKTS